mgnify:CR=1 FL=1
MVKNWPKNRLKIGQKLAEKSFKNWSKNFWKNIGTIKCIEFFIYIWIF